MEIILNNINYTYKKIGFDDFKILDNVNMIIKNNEITSLIGNNSSGISTLLLIIGSLIEPTKGTIKNKISSKTIGFVNEISDEQFYNDTVYNELKSCLILNESTKNIDKRINDSLIMVNLNPKILKRNPHDLSLGEKRKLGFACALITNPDIIILDNPTIGLDANGKNELIKLLRLLKKRYNKTIIITSHDIDFIHFISDKIFVLDNKKIILEGNKYDVFKQTKILDFCKISLPKTIIFSNYVFKNKKIKLGYRDEINDLIKDIYRNTTYKKENL